MPPLYQIVYTSARTDHAITQSEEWVTDPTYDRDRARRSFEHRHPGTAVVRVEETD